jgi:phosphatidylinositol phospholipase C delta
MATTTDPKPNTLPDGIPTVPLLLQHGTQVTKISEKSQKKIILRIDPEEGQILYDSRKHGLGACVQPLHSSSSLTNLGLSAH